MCFSPARRLSIFFAKTWTAVGKRSFNIAKADPSVVTAFTCVGALSLTALLTGVKGGPSKVGNWATAMQYHQTICVVLFSFSRTSNLIRYISHIPLKVGNASLFVCLHGCAVACASCAIKQTIAQCRFFLEGTLGVTCTKNLTLISRVNNCFFNEMLDLKQGCPKFSKHGPHFDIRKSWRAAVNIQ